jgi:hypothetical protein
MTASNAGGAVMYGTMPGNQWAGQPASTYAGHTSDTTASFYGRYYRSGSLSKAESTRFSSRIAPNKNAKFIGHLSNNKSFYAFMTLHGELLSGQTRPLYLRFTLHSGSHRATTKQGILGCQCFDLALIIPKKPPIIFHSTVGTRTQYIELLWKLLGVALSCAFLLLRLLTFTRPFSSCLRCLYLYFAAATLFFSRRRCFFLLV